MILTGEEKRYKYGHRYDGDFNDNRIIIRDDTGNRYLVAAEFYLEYIYPDLIDQGYPTSDNYHPVNGYKVGIGKKVNKNIIDLKDSKTGLRPELMGEHNINMNKVNMINIYKYKNLLIKLDGIKYTQSEELKYKFKNITNNDTSKTGLVYYAESGGTLNIHNKLICNLYVKILNYEESSSLFGFKPTKKEMMGKYYKIDNIDYNQICKKDDIERSVVEVYNNELGKNFKFILSDLEVQIPDLTEFIKGYNPPKDRNVKVGLNVKVINNKLTRLNIGDRLKVIDIPKKNIPVHNQYKDRCTLILCVNEQGKQFNLKIKQVKVI